MITCNNTVCPYISKLGICLKKITSINANGQCKQIYNNNGTVKENWNVKDNSQMKEVIVTSVDV